MAEGLDLLELGEDGLYFDEPCLPEVEALIAQAAYRYGHASAEQRLLRFHLLALKASAVILLRLGRLDEARLRLAKIAEVDERDALGAAPLLAVIEARQGQEAAEISH